MIITIDGPAGSGKSTVARLLARRLGVAYLDTGAMYRAAALAALRRGIDLQDGDALARLARGLDLQLDGHADPPRVLLDGEDVSRLVRSADVTEKTAFLARVPGVREAMVARQRQVGLQLGSLVSEGRDQGSVVFPQADFKFFLDARPEVRAGRRRDDLAAAGEHVAAEQVLAQIAARDGADRGRAVAPLIEPEGAIRLDSSDMTIEQVVEAMLRLVRAEGERT